MLRRSAVVLPSLAILLLFPATLFAGDGVIQVPGEMSLQTALSTVGQGGEIEIAAGSYNAPAGGWLIADRNVDFTVRAATPGTVTLSGDGDRVLRYVNDFGGAYSVLFEGLTFAGGVSIQDGFGGGVTMKSATATFVDCRFENNSSLAPSTGGGGVFMFNGSVAHFFDVVFDGNTARNEGGALRVGTGASAFVHRSQFLNNRTNVANHRPSAAGGAIHVTNATLQVADSRFEGNEGGCVGGAIYVLGSWNDPVTTPAAEVTVANSTFVDNRVASDSTVTCAFAPVGGAIHSEDQATVRVHHSRFDTNSADIGGAVSQYRSIVEIRDSALRGNFATGEGTSNFGGAILSNSNDANDATTDFGAINRRSARLLIEDSLFQGRFGGTGTAALKGGCLFALGDQNRTFGIGGVPQMGGAATNRAQIDLVRTVFADCDVVQDPATNGTGTGGAISVGHTDLTLTDSLIVGSDALGTTSAAGAIRLLTQSLATVTGTTFAYNTAEDRAGAIQVSGSTLAVDDCRFFGNAVTDGGSGSSIWSIPAIFFGVELDVEGTVANSDFSDEFSRPIQEFDNSEGPINDLVYDGNRFFFPPSGSVVFGNTIAGTHSVASLNSLVVNRDSGVPSTDKSTVGNTDLGSQPELGELIAAPPWILGVHAAGDPAPPSTSFLGYAWSAAPGTDVELFGVTVPADWGIETAGSGVHTLAVGNETFLASITDAPIPDAELAAVPQMISGGGSADLDWSTLAGTFLGVSIDRRVAVGSQTASGSVAVTPATTTTYRLSVLTEEGGATDSATVFVDELPGFIFGDDFESGNTSAWTATVQ